MATPDRGLVYGNRGCMHDASGQIRRRWGCTRWIACQLQFRGWRRSPLLQPGRFTELFFLDEATALAAGHRPCALCRRADYNRFGAIWAEVHPGQRGADAIDAQLQGERVVAGSGERRLHETSWGDLPDGVFVMHQNEPKLVLGRELVTWSTGGYGDRRRRPAGGTVSVITPPSLVAVLRTGWTSLVPLLHPTAR